MAETVHLYLKANGAEIKGESTQTSLGRADSIECVYYEQATKTVREKGSGLALGRRQYEPMIIRKRIDRSSPLLVKAMADNQRIEAKFKFFRPSPAGDGTTEQFYTVEISGGRIASVKQIVPDSLVPATSTEPPLEEITIVVHTIRWAYEPTGAEHQDSWDQNA